ncbi:MAG: Dabb family protein [Bacteroidales bacterium]|jgi:hypothetical protein|nr:Dabb family protein [Bacteroidales bacterium]
MLKHIVMMRFKSTEPHEKLQQMQKLKQLLKNLKSAIEELDFLEVGLNLSKRPNAFDLVLVTHFKSEKELELYRVHPEHVKILNYLHEVISETVVVDYLVDFIDQPFMRTFQSP